MFLLFLFRFEKNVKTFTHILKEMSDFDENKFPSATTAHWKVLLREIKMEQAGHVGRQLKAAAALDTKGFVGVRISNDKSFVTLGLYFLLSLSLSLSPFLSLAFPSLCAAIVVPTLQIISEIRPVCKAIVPTLIRCENHVQAQRKTLNWSAPDRNNYPWRQTA